MVAVHSFQSEMVSRGARMLRTALGPSIAAWLEDPIIVEVMLNPDGRLWVDRLSGGLSDTGERLERHITISNEALALFVRFWLTATPPLPDTAQPAAQTKGRERYEGFVEALGRRLARGQTFAQEISLDIEPGQASPIVPQK